MRRVDGYLSRRAQLTWPGAIVYEEVTGAWTLERPSTEPLGLGRDFADARRALAALAAAEHHTPERRAP